MTLTQAISKKTDTAAAVSSTIKADSRRPLDTRAWLVWIAGMTLPAMLTINPWYQLIVISIVALSWPAGVQNSQTGFFPLKLLLRIAAITLLFGSAFNALTIHYGQIALFHIPDAIPILGGQITLEALLYGIMNALRLISILFVFSLFSRVINYADLIRLAPSALFELGLMMSIGFTLIPFTLRAFREIREAQSLRGYRPNGIRGLIPLFTPLVVSGMEHALSLAESMEARGYGGSTLTRRARIGQGLAVLSLIGMLGLLILQTIIPLPTWSVIVTIGVIFALMFGAIWQLSRASGRSRLRHSYWGGAETITVLGALLPMIVLLMTDPRLLAYDPYRISTIGLPTFNPWIGQALLALAIPALLGKIEPGEPAAIIDETNPQA